MHPATCLDFKLNVFKQIFPPFLHAIFTELIFMRVGDTAASPGE